MKHYLFCETVSGEEFIVGEYNFSDAASEAEDVAREIGDQWNEGEWTLKYYGELTEEEAEASGLDEY